MISFRAPLFRVYWWLERRIVPGLRYSQLHYEDSLSERLEENARWLDLGCGKRVLPPFRSEAEKALIDRAVRVVGVDLSFDQVARHESIEWRVVASGDRLPFPAEHFDLVTANMVVEHLETPTNCFREVHRVLRPGGLFLFHTPNAKAYGPRLARNLPNLLKRSLVRVLEGRTSDDVFPAFYRANTPSDVASLAQNTGFEPEAIETVLSTAQTAMIPPLAALELLWLRRLRRPESAEMRPTLIASLRKGRGESPLSGHVPASHP